MAKNKYWTGLALGCLALPALSQTTAPFDAAAAFGARETVEDVSLSPDGETVAYIAPAAGQGSVMYTWSLAKGAQPHAALSTDGKSERLGGCRWVSNARLICYIFGIVKNPSYGLLPFTRAIAVNADGGNFQMLSTRNNSYTRGLQLGGGVIIDWLPDDDGLALMTRVYLPDSHIGSRLGSDSQGTGVDRIDTRNLSTHVVEPPRDSALKYISDGRGNVRIMALRAKVGADGQDSGFIDYLYRLPGSRDWHPLSQSDSRGSGFEPLAVDHDLNVAYGFKRKDGRQALYSVALDADRSEKLIYARPDVDVDELVSIGRRHRIVGVSYVTDFRSAIFFDPDIEKVARSLNAALPGHPQVRIVDSNIDESKLLVFASSDQDPGVYYLLDRKSHEMKILLVARHPLEGAKLAAVKPIQYPAADGTLIPGYLTLPAGVASAKGLPAIVLPHGGPAARDEWGFDWLSQYFASRGYAVLQPNFRGSAGYGEEWFKENGFKSWRIAIGDVLDAGRWLVAQGADPAKLGIVGWSYGGYAALQSAVVDPSLFKAVVAIAPVTDLNSLKEEHRNWSDYQLLSDYVGDGPHITEGSPAQNANKIKVPVLIFHGALDRNVAIEESREMDSRLAAAGARHELVTWDNLDHQLVDSAARSDMLRRSDEFLRSAMGK